MLRKRLTLLLVTAVLAATMVAGPAMGDLAPKDQCPTGTEPGPPVPPEQRDDWQRICHRTGSDTNPFVVINPNCNAQGHLPPPPQHPPLDDRQDSVVADECS